MAYSTKEIKEKFNEICDLISKEGYSLRKALRQNKMPDAVTFYKWLDSSEDKIKQYARACADRADYFADEIIKISDEQNADTYVTDDGVTVTDGAAIQRSKLKVDTRKWLMSKMQPKKYGDKLDVTSDGEKISAPILNIDPFDKANDSTTKD